MFAKFRFRYQITSWKLNIDIAFLKSPEFKDIALSEKVEGEVHFLTKCTLYQGRETFFNFINSLFHNFNSLNNQNKSIFLMTQENVKYKLTNILFMIGFCSILNMWINIIINLSCCFFATAFIYFYKFKYTLMCYWNLTPICN